MKKDYNKPKKIKRNYDNIAELKAAQEQSLEKIKYTEDKLERLWRLVGNIEIIDEKDDTKLIYSGYANYTNIPSGDPVKYYVVVPPTNVNISDFNLNKTFFSYSLSGSSYYMGDLHWVGWIEGGEYHLSAESITTIPVPFSGTIYIRIFATTFV